MNFNKRKIDEDDDKIYYTNDEGKRSFKVVVNKNNTTIYKEEILGSNNYNRFVVKYIPEEIYIGNSNVNILLNGNLYEGNSILLKLRRTYRDIVPRYVFIGHNIYEFTLEDGDQILTFHSIVENNTSYPVLLTTSNVYFLLDYVYINKHFFPNNISFNETNNYYIELDQHNLYDFENPIKNKKFIHNSLYD